MEYSNCIFIIPVQGVLFINSQGGMLLYIFDMGICIPGRDVECIAFLLYIRFV